MNILIFCLSLFFGSVGIAVCVFAIQMAIDVLFDTLDVIKDRRDKKKDEEKNKQLQTPKKVMCLKGYYRCPECRECLTTAPPDDAKRKKFAETLSKCWQCGQRLDWRKEE